ncbi:hypothetical protein AB0C98_42200 [Streptomyces sp. NPDC048558]|uniref:hypothetical protein n=1 Tax=Streptomyces sp. NPDC048558 TaxID=3155759 RepID=UPI003433A459
MGLGVEAGPVPVADGVPGVPAEGFLAGAELEFGLVADGVLVPPEAPGLCCPPGVAPPVEGAVGDVGMAEPPSERPPEPEGDESAAGAGAALDWVGAVAARPSIWVPIEPLPGEEDVPPDDAAPDEGVDWGLGDDRPDTPEPPPEWEGPAVLGAPAEPLEPGELDDAPPGEGSSKSDRDDPDGATDGLEYGVSEEDGFGPEPELESDPEPESGPGPTFGPPMSLPPVSADIPLPMFVPGPLPLLERDDVEESDESDDPDDPESEEELELELELPEPESPLPLLPSPLPSAPAPLLLPGVPDGPLYPSIRLSIAWWKRSPAFLPMLSRTPSANVCGLCFRASRPAVPPAFMVAPTS